VVAQFKAWVCGRSLTGIAGSNPAKAWMSVSCDVLCCKVEVSGTSPSLVQRSPTEWCVCVCVCVCPECDQVQPSTYTTSK